MNRDNAAYRFIPMKKRRQDVSPTRVPPAPAPVPVPSPPIPTLTIEQQYKLYTKELGEFYKANKKKYIAPLFEKLITAGIFARNTNTAKDVPWQLVKMQAKVDFDKDRN